MVQEGKPTGAVMLADAASPDTPTPTEGYLLAVWRAIFESESIALDDDFFALGGYSLLAARLLAEVAQRFGVALPPRQLVDTPTIRELAAALDRTVPDGRIHRLGLRSLAPIRLSGSRPPLFCMHPLDGSIACYAPLADYLGPDQPLFGLQARGLSTDEPPLGSIPEMAAAYLREIRAIQPEGPYYLVGYSLGGLIAYEAAQQLRAQSREVALLALIDTALPPHFSAAGEPSAERQYRRHVIRRIPHHLRAAIALRPKGMVRYLGTRAKFLAVRQVRHLWMGRLDPERLANRPGAGPHQDAARRFQDIATTCGLAAQRYRPAPYGGRVLYLSSAREGPSSLPDQRRSWEALARGGLDHRAVGGDHRTILEGEHTRTLADLLRAAIEPAAPPSRPAG